MPLVSASTHGANRNFWTPSCMPHGEACKHAGEASDSSVHASSVAQSCPTLCDPWSAAPQASLSITNSQSLHKLMSIKLVMPSGDAISSYVIPFSFHVQSFPASGSFPMSQFFASGGQSIGSFSFSISPSNEHSRLMSFRRD